MTTVVDLYAGAGGWCVAAEALGLDVTGVEVDNACVKTREAAGFETVHDDIRNLDPIPADGLIASPTCQTFSAAGRGSGRRNLDEVLDIAHRLILGEDWWTLTKGLEDERTALVIEPLHWIFEMRKAGTPYRWIAMEQVPPVLPVWEYYAELLRWMGYSSCAEILHSEQFGVPQTRKRAILLASLDHDVEMPTPTHSKYYPRDPQRVDEGVEKWCSMAEALGWNNNDAIGFPRRSDGLESIDIDGVEYRARDLREGDEPAFNLTEKVRSWQRWKFRQSALSNATVRDPDQPAPTITAAHDSGERVWMLSAGRTSPDTAGSRPRSEDEPSATMVARNVAVWTGERPAPTLTTTRRSSDGGLVGRQLPEGEGRNVGGHNWPDKRPATTVNGDPRISKPGHHDEHTSGSQQAGAVRVTPEEAAILQSFPEGFPFQGTKTSIFRQIGNAVPPLLALHVLAAATGQKLELAAMPASRACIDDKKETHVEYESHDHHRDGASRGQSEDPA